jgi:hypothetical protein
MADFSAVSARTVADLPSSGSVLRQNPYFRPIHPPEHPAYKDSTIRLKHYTRYSDVIEPIERFPETRASGVVPEADATAAVSGDTQDLATGYGNTEE